MTNTTALEYGADSPTLLLDSFVNRPVATCDHCGREAERCPWWQENILAPVHKAHNSRRACRYRQAKAAEKARQREVELFGRPLCPWCRLAPILPRKPGSRGRSPATCGADACRKALKKSQQRKRRAKPSDSPTAVPAAMPVRPARPSGVLSPELNEIVFYGEGTRDAGWVYRSYDGTVVAGVGERLSDDDWSVVRHYANHQAGHITTTSMLRLEAYVPDDSQLLRKAEADTRKAVKAGRLVGNIEAMAA